MIRVNKTVLGLAVLSAMLQLSSSMADTPAVDERIYITSKMVHYTHNEFIVITSGTTYATEALYTDEKGLYVKKSELERIRSFPKDKDADRFWRDLHKKLSNKLK